MTGINANFACSDTKGPLWQTCARISSSARNNIAESLLHSSNACRAATASFALHASRTHVRDYMETRRSHQPPRLKIEGGKAKGTVWDVEKTSLSHGPRDAAKRENFENCWITATRYF